MVHPMTDVRSQMSDALDSLCPIFDVASTVDPIQIVRRYDDVADREIVAFVAAGLAFGRVASVMASVEAVCQVLGPSPAAFVRAFEPERDGADLRRLRHRWIRGVDLVALVWILRQLLERYGSIEASVVRHLDAGARDVSEALQAWSDDVRCLDLVRAYGRLAEPRAGVWYFFATPSTGSACKRLNLFLRWMVRQDAVDPGGWTAIRPSQLVVPLDTHTIRLGQCLRLTKRATPGWKMAAEITDGLRRLDPDDPVRYDFALCHLGMMGGCGWGTRQRNTTCPLRAVCRPKGQRRKVRAS